MISGSPFRHPLKQSGNLKTNFKKPLKPLTVVVSEAGLSSAERPLEIISISH